MMNKMIFEIRNVKNGCILEITDTETEEKEETVYQELGDDEVENFARFLWYLLEEYGPITSRHSEKRIHIEIKPGDKWDDK